MQQATYVAQEEVGSVQVCALLEGQIARSVPISFSTFDGSAEGIEYSITNF